MKILLAVDDPSLDEALVEAVQQHYWRPDAQLRVVHVIPSVLGYSAMSAFPDLIAELREQARNSGEALVRKTALVLRDSFHRTDIEEYVVEGNAAEEIVSMAKQWSADVILVGAHGRGGFERALMGSVSTAVVAHAPCSVMVVKPSRERVKHKAEHRAGSERVATR